MRVNRLNTMKKDVRKRPLQSAKSVAARLMEAPKPATRVGQKK